MVEEKTMTTQEIANRMSELFKENKWAEVQDEFSDIFSGRTVWLPVTQRFTRFMVAAFSIFTWRPATIPVAQVSLTDISDTTALHFRSEETRSFTLSVELVS